MAFDPATLLSRTTAGDSELSTPTNGLSLGQRKLLTYLDQPHALEELAAEHALELVKLDRDLAKLASLNLIAIDGQDTRALADSVVLGGSRTASMLRWLLPPLLLVGAGLLYFGLSAPVARKPGAPPLKLSATPSAISPATAASVAAPTAITNAVVAAPAITHVPSPAAPADASPASRREAAPVDVDGANGMSRRDAKAVAIPEPVKPAMLDSTAKPATIADVTLPASAAQATGPLIKGEPIVRSPAAPPPVARTEPNTAHAATSAALVAVTAQSPTPAKAPTVAAGTTTITAGPTTITAGDSATAAHAITAAASAAPTPATGAATATATATAAAVAAVAAKPAAAAKSATAAPDKLAMAAPSSADAHPRAAPKLLPIAHDEPEFPREALARGVSSGTVKARLAIDAGGKVTAVAIVDSRPGRVFDRAVTQALSRWTFPAGDAGRSTEVEIDFKRD
jgi:TonB family protein